ncbi:MAG: hypothetical protein ACOX4J_04605 [Anaerovoracaceae bacterium]
MTLVRLPRTTQANKLPIIAFPTPIQVTESPIVPPELAGIPDEYNYSEK